MAYITSFERVIREDALEEGERRGKLKTARNFLRSGVDINIIAKATGLTKEEIRNAASEPDETTH